MDRKMITKSVGDVIDLSIDDDEDDLSHVIGGEPDGVDVINIDDNDEISEWDAEVRKNFSHIADGLDDEHLLWEFMDKYLRELEDMSGCYEDSEDLRQKVQNHVEFLHSFFLELECRSENSYLETMENILTEYMKLELNVIRKVVKVNKKTKNQIKATAQRIIRMLAVILLNQNSHMLHVLIKQSDNYDASGSCREVLGLIYSHYLIQLPLDKSDEEFCRRYIVFQKWKNLLNSSQWNEIDRVMYKQHNRAPESIETNDVLRPILMPSGESTVDVVRLCYDGLYQIANRYFKYLASKKEQVYDTEFDVDLSNFMFQDDDIAAISDLNSEDMELSKACESFMKGLSLAGKASSSASYDKNQRCKEETLEMEDDEEVSSALLLDKDVFSLGDMNVSLPSVGSIEKEIATVSERTHLEPPISEGTHPEPTISEETHLEPTIPEGTHPEPTISEKTHLEPTIPEGTHPEPTVSEETRPELAVPEVTNPGLALSEETQPGPAVSEETHSGPALSEETHSAPALSEETHPGTAVSQEILLKSTVFSKIHPEHTVSEKTQPKLSVSVVSVEKITEDVSLKDPVTVGTEVPQAGDTSTFYGNEQSLDVTNIEVVDMELCSGLVPGEEIVEQYQSSDDTDLACPELTPEVSISATCPELIPEVLSSNSTLRAPTLVSVKNYSYKYGQVTPPSDVSSDDHNGDRVVVYPKPVQPSRKTTSCASHVNGVHQRTETITRECITALSKQIPSEVLPSSRVSSVQSHSVISSVSKRRQDPRTKNVRGRGAAGFMATPPASKVDTEKVTDNLDVQLNKTIDTGQIRVVPVNTMQNISVCNSVKIQENTFSLEGFTRFEQLQNEIMNGPVSKATPVKPVLTADERSDFERDLFSSKVTLVQRPLQAPPPISGDESSRSNSPSDSPSPAYEVIEKDDCKDHFAHSFKDANGANGSRALVPRVNRPRTPKSILKKGRSATPRKKKSDHIKFNEVASVSYFDTTPAEDASHDKYLQQILRREAVVLPGDMRPSMMEDPKLNEQPKVVLKTNIRNKINEYTRSDQFIARYGIVPQANSSGSGTIRVDFDKSNGSAKLNDKDVVSKCSTPGTGIEIEKTIGFRQTNSGWMMFLKNRDYLEKKPKKRKTAPSNHVTGDSIPTEKKKRGRPRKS